MSIIGILCWYDEQPEWLAATAASMCHAGMRHVVALDGAYLYYPGSIRHPRSEPGQGAAIREVCEALGVGMTHYAPTEPYVGNETEKRSLGFQLAELVAEPGEDWYFLMDADQVITHTGNLHNVLGATSLDVADALFYERGGGQSAVRCIFRAVPGLRVEGRHYDYISADGRNLWGDPPLLPAAMTGCEVEHRSHLRAPARKQAQQAYYQRRDELGAEAQLVSQ